MTIRFELDSQVALITLDAPEKRNALSSEMFQALGEAWLRAANDDDVTAVVITGAQGSFCSGADTTEVVETPEALEAVLMVPKLGSGIHVWKPVVAAVDGPCLGAGMTLLLTTDVRVASHEARFGLPEVGHGLVPGNGGTYRLFDQLPYAIAMEVLLADRRLSAAEALKYGLINHVVSSDRLKVFAFELAQRMGSASRVAVQAAKRLALAYGAEVRNPAEERELFALLQLARARGRSRFPDQK